jgi:UDPglucose--hexose-1-phosphate uridylyltransferase
MEHKTDNAGKWEKRWHPLRREWVVYAAHRNSRPWNFDVKPAKTEAPAYDPTCYLCPGNPRVSGKSNPGYQDVFIFDNDHPVVGLDAPAIAEDMLSAHDGLYKRGSATGIARVVCYDPRHNVSLSELDTEQIARVFRALREQMVEFRQHPKISSVLIFENKGELVGVSNPHPHCQIYATDFHFNMVRREMEAMHVHRQQKDTNLFGDIIKAERSDRVRIISESETAISFIPYFARFAYEAWIFPKKRHATLITMTDDEIYGLAEAFRVLTRKYDGLFRSSFPYVMAIAQAPVDGGYYEDYHMHLVFSPPLRQPGLQKFLAGPETGADTFMADTMPEDKAAELQKVDI